MVMFKVTEQHYGWIFAIVAAGLIGATQYNTFLLRRFSSEQIVRTALYTQTIIGIVLVSTSIFQINELYSTVTLIFLFLCCQGFIFPNASALSMAPFAHNAGSASALMGFIQMSIGAMMSAVVSVLQNGTSLPMTGVMALCSFTASLMLAFSSKRLLKKATIELVKEEEVEMISTI